MKYLIGLFSVLILLFSCKEAQQNEALEQVEPQYEKVKSDITKPISDTTSEEDQIEKQEKSKPKNSEAVRIVSAEQATIEIFKEAAPSVCYINTSNLRRDYYSRNVYEQPSGSGSGFIWDKEGHVVTNYHVIKGASKATVTLADHTTYDAKLVGIEPNKDLAVLKIDAPRNSLIPLPPGTSNDLTVGQYVYAIGNPFGLDQTLTTGVISALGREIKSLTGRPIRDVIQTDAAINPGNSGGPLLDTQGKLIGVNTQIYSPSGASAGIGFSIPVDEVSWVVPDLIKYGEVRRPILGVSLLPSQYARDFGVTSGVMVAELVKGGPAEKAGLFPLRRSRRGDVSKGDIITRLNDKSIEDYNDLVLTLEKYNPGDLITLGVLRDEEEIKIELTLGESN